MNKAQWIHNELAELLWLKNNLCCRYNLLELKRDEVKNVNK